MRVNGAETKNTLGHARARGHSVGEKKNNCAVTIIIITRPAVQGRVRATQISCSSIARRASRTTPVRTRGRLDFYAQLRRIAPPTAPRRSSGRRPDDVYRPNAVLIASFVPFVVVSAWHPCVCLCVRVCDHARFVGWRRRISTLPGSESDFHHLRAPRLLKFKYAYKVQALYNLIKTHTHTHLHLKTS